MTELELIRDAQQGDRAAFGELALRHEKKLPYCVKFISESATLANEKKHLFRLWQAQRMIVII